MKRAAWIRELAVTASWCLIGALIGFWVGATFAGVALALAMRMLSQLYYLIALRLWVENPKHIELTVGNGIWAGIFD